MKLVAGDVDDVALPTSWGWSPSVTRARPETIITPWSWAWRSRAVRPPARYLEVAHPVLARALGLADQLVLADARKRGIVVGLRFDALPPAGRRQPGGG